MIRDYCRHDQCKLYKAGTCEMLKRITIYSENSKPWTRDMCERKR